MNRVQANLVGVSVGARVGWGLREMQNDILKRASSGIVIRGVDALVR